VPRRSDDPDQSRVPPDLRPAGNRKATRRKPPAEGTKTAQAARAGIWTRGNTKEGTLARQAADHVAYQGRTRGKGGRVERPSRIERGLSARQAAGHDVPTATRRYLNSAGELREIEATRGETRRIARYDALVSNLAQGNVTPEAFAKRVGSWEPIRGERFLSDPAAALAKAEELKAAGESLWIEGEESP
jgi:hypothetical protein